MHALRRFWRLPIVKVTVVCALLAVAAGVVRGYAGLARATIEQHGSVDFGLFYASARQHLEGGPSMARSSGGERRTQPNRQT